MYLFNVLEIVQIINLKIYIIMSNIVKSNVKFEKLEVTRIVDNGIQLDDTLTIEFKQTAYKILPDLQKSENDLGLDALGFEKPENEFESFAQTRVAWLRIPNKNFKKLDEKSVLKQVEQQIKNKTPNACIIEERSNYPILTHTQKAVLKSNKYNVDYEKIAENQLVRYSNADQPELEGQIVIDNFGKPQYKKNTLKWKKANDIDTRNDKDKDFYACQSVKMLFETMEEDAPFTESEAADVF